MRPVVLVFVFFAALMALVTAYLVKVWLDAQTPVVVQQQQPAEPTGMVKVLVAARPIATGTKLTRDDFKWVSWPKAALQDRFIDTSKISEAALDAQQAPPSGASTPVVNSSGDEGEAAAGTVLIGSVARRQIMADEPIGLEAIIQPGNRSIVSAVIAPGMRAISIPIQSESASAGFIGPGDRVDVLLAQNLKATVVDKIKGQEAQGEPGSGESNGISTWATETVLFNAKVLAVDQQLSHDAKDGPAVMGKILTLEVSPRDAERLFAAQQLGSFSITLRSLLSDRSDSAKVRDTDNPSFHPFTGDTEVSRALDTLTRPMSEETAPPTKPSLTARTTVRFNRGGVLSEQSF
ncbi:MAG TPA: Flp pilus assembly protein CpaB [Dongiaceae bacterium]|nr:Flp pilus assembly protein CpaB [Dongiaceae bacterium]